MSAIVKKVNWKVGRSLGKAEAEAEGETAGETTSERRAVYYLVRSNDQDEDNAIRSGNWEGS